METHAAPANGGVSPRPPPPAESTAPSSSAPTTAPTTAATTTSTTDTTKDPAPPAAAESPPPPAGLDITPRPGETAAEAKARAVDEALDCPCIDAMREGPCGPVFLTAYRCFLESESTPRGEECAAAFTAMHECVVAHPEMYGDDEEEGDEAAAAAPRGGGGADAVAGGGAVPVATGRVGGGGSASAPDVALASSVTEKEA